jgi:hypothetical protein
MPKAPRDFIIVGALQTGDAVHQTGANHARIKFSQFAIGQGLEVQAPVGLELRVEDLLVLRFSCGRLADRRRALLPPSKHRLQSEL